LSHSSRPRRPCGGICRAQRRFRLKWLRRFPRPLPVRRSCAYEATTERARARPCPPSLPLPHRFHHPRSHPRRDPGTRHCTQVPVPHERFHNYFVRRCLCHMNEHGKCEGRDPSCPVSAPAPAPAPARRALPARSPRIHAAGRDKTCPVSTGGWTRRVHFVREGGGGRPGYTRLRGARGARAEARLRWLKGRMQSNGSKVACRWRGTRTA
jgi:hypothetical protein